MWGSPPSNTHNWGGGLHFSASCLKCLQFVIIELNIGRVPCGVNMVSAHDLRQLLQTDLSVLVNVKQGKGLLDQKMSWTSWRRIIFTLGSVRSVSSASLAMAMSYFYLKNSSSSGGCLPMQHIASHYLKQLICFLRWNRLDHTVLLCQLHHFISLFDIFSRIDIGNQTILDS